MEQNSEQIMEPKSQRDQQVERAQAMKRAQEEKKMMKTTVDDMEIKARYWKAQWEIRFYTLEAETLLPQYNEFLEEQKQIALKQREEFMAAMKNMQDQGAKVEEDGVELSETQVEGDDTLGVGSNLPVDNNNVN